MREPLIETIENQETKQRQKPGWLQIMLKRLQALIPPINFFNIKNIGPRNDNGGRLIIHNSQLI
jgi:hypothetical protein